MTVETSTSTTWLTVGRWAARPDLATVHLPSVARVELHLDRLDQRLRRALDLLDGLHQTTDTGTAGRPDHDG